VAYREQWLSEFSAPLDASKLDAMRQVGVAATLRRHYSGTARNGMIALVPGNVRVLDARYLAGRSSQPASD
jgi:hypothetical protein